MHYVSSKHFSSRRIDICWQFWIPSSAEAKSRREMIAREAFKSGAFCKRKTLFHNAIEVLHIELQYPRFRLELHIDWRRREIP